jgi:hypothetical protein
MERICSLLDLPEHPLLPKVEQKTQERWKRFPDATMILAPPEQDSFALMAPFHGCFIDTNIMLVDKSGETSWSDGIMKTHQPWSVIAGFPTPVRPFYVTSVHRYIIWLMHPLNWLREYNSVVPRVWNPQLRNLLGLDRVEVITGEHFEKAEKRLRNALCIGLYERLLESFEIIQEKLNWKHDGADGIFKSDTRGEVPRFLKKDFRLYQMAQNIFGRPLD